MFDYSPKPCDSIQPAAFRHKRRASEKTKARKIYAKYKGCSAQRAANAARAFLRRLFLPGHAYCPINTRAIAFR